jgi:hypothetical protein
MDSLNIQKYAKSRRYRGKIVNFVWLTDEKMTDRLILGVLTLLLAAGCARNRFDYIDIAASEKALASLEEGFKAVPDSVADGRVLFLLGQGVPVADVLVYQGETGDVLFQDPALPFGYTCETVGTAVLMDSLHVKAGRLYTDGGLNARMLYLQDGRMSLGVLNKVADLAAHEAFIGGVKPSVCLDKEDDAVFQRTVEKVWLSGNVMSGRTVKSILKAAGVKPDVRTKTDSLFFQHRHLPDLEIYRISNLGRHAGPVKLRFRVRGRQPYQWNPDTGAISPVSYKLRKRSTWVTIQTVPGDDTFLVFGSFSERKRLKIK